MSLSIVSIFSKVKKKKKSAVVGGLNHFYLLLLPHRPISTIATTQSIVTMTAVTTNIVHCPQVAPVAVRGTPAVEKPAMTTWVQIIPMTIPNAVPSDVATVFFISPMLIMVDPSFGIFSPPMFLFFFCIFKAIEI